jgi:hypothetical protein
MEKRIGAYTTREVLINDALPSSLKVPQTSLKLFCDKLVTKIVSSWNEHHKLTTVMKRLFPSLISFHSMTRGAWPLTIRTSQQRKLALICCALGCDKGAIG